MIAADELVVLLDYFHGTKGLHHADAARLGVQLETMDSTDLLTAGAWYPPSGSLLDDFGPAAMVWTNIRGLIVGFDHSGNVYKIDRPLGTWFATSYSTAGSDADHGLPRRETLACAKVRAEAHRRFLHHQAREAATTSGS